MATTAEEFDRYSLRNGADQCIKFQQGAFTYEKRAFVSEWGAMPYVSVSRQSHDSSMGIGMLLIGGPAGHIWGEMDGPFAEFLRGLTASFDTVVVPAYYGTSYRNLWPSPSIEKAVPELLAFADHLESRSGQPVHYISGSMGGLILNEIARVRNRPMFLIAPPLIPMRDELAQRTYTAAQLSVKTIHYISGPSGRDFLTRPVIRKIPRSEFVPTYFGKYYAQSIVDSETGKWRDLGACATVLVGTEDGRIGLSDALERWPDLPIEVMEGVNHDFTDEEWERQEVLRRVESWRDEMSARECSSIPIAQ